MDLEDYHSEEHFLTQIGTFVHSYLRKYAAKIDRTGELPTNINDELAKRRLFALTALDKSSTPLSLEKRYKLALAAVETLARVSASVAKMVLDQNLGQVPLFQEYASPEMVSKYLPRIQDGTVQMALLMTEPHAGSSFTNFRCTATTVDGGYLINGRKDWITGAKSRSLYLVVARSKIDSEDFGLFLINKSESQETIDLSEKKELLGLRGLGEYSVQFKDTFVPELNAIIPPRRSTPNDIMKHYNIKRCGQAAIAIGLATSALSISYDYLGDRYPTEGGGLAFQSADFTCAEMYCWIQASRQLNKWALRTAVRGDETGVPCSVAKLIATESAVKITNLAIQLCGAAGTSRELPLERFMRDARMLTIAGGTSEIQKRTIAKHLPDICKRMTNPRYLDPMNEASMSTPHHLDHSEPGVG